MNKLPAKFEICTKYNRTSRYILTLNAEGYYEIVPKERSLDDAYDVLKKYSQGFVKEAVQDGMWEITANLDEHLSEPDMVFPFYVTHRDDRVGVATCVTKGTLEDHVTLEDFTGSFNNYYSLDKVKQLIKDGTWIVKHVGEKEPEQPVEAPQSTPLSSLSLSITVDAEDAVAGIKGLTDAYEDLAVTLESVIALYRELREVA